MALKIGVILSSLPTYFPQKYGVFEQVVKTIDSICRQQQVPFVVAKTVPMNGDDTRAVLDDFQRQGVSFVILVHGGFTMGDVAREVATSTLPTAIWATVEPTLEGDVQLNNFVSLNMSMSIFRKCRDCNAHPVVWVYGNPQDAHIQRQLTTQITALKVKHQLQSLKIGLIGNVAPTFYNMQVSTLRLKQQLGVSVEEDNIQVLLQRMDAVDNTKIQTEYAKMQQHIDFSAMNESQIDKTIRCVLALRKIAQDGGYGALAVSDWPVLQQAPYSMHPGMAFSWLEHCDSLPVASEGDVLGAVTQYVALQITGRVGCILDMTLPQYDTDRILLWHGGGGALSYADGYTDGKKVSCVPHPMIGRGTDTENSFGAIADFQFATGEYSVFRISDDGCGLWAIAADIRPAETGATGYTGCRGWIHNYRSVQGTCDTHAIVSSIMKYGIEHHFILAPNCLLDILQSAATWCQMHIYPIDNTTEK